MSVPSPVRTRLLRLAGTPRCPKVHGMIYRYLLAALLLCAPGVVLAQLRLELEFEQETYLPREDIYAVVRIYNSSGQELVFGRDDHWLSFTIEPSDGGVVLQNKPVNVRGEFKLPNGSRAKKVVNLADAFELTKFGRYYVTASLHVPEWGETFSTPKRKHFGISTGVKLWETAFGVPNDKTDGRPEVRKFQIVQANHLRQLSLYVRITDESGAETFTLFPLGAVVGFSKPEPQMDRWCNLHVFYQDAAKSFRYFMVTPDGLLLARQTWELTDNGRPALTMNSEGRISVTGGVRRVSASDLPPPELLSDKSRTALQVEERADAQKADK